MQASHERTDLTTFDLDDRRSRIQAAPTEGHSFVPFQGTYRKIPVVRVPHQALMYRAENGRLIAELHEQAGPSGVSVAEILASPEAQATQAMLHGLLLAKAQDPSGPIFAELARHAEQTEPLLVSQDGLVVNGNRRLAAMRTLLNQDAERYARFAHVAVAVLPSEAQAADFDDVEAALQMAPDLKLAYGWINRRMTLRRQRIELGVPIEKIAETYRIEDHLQIDREIAELSLLDDFLAYQSQPGAYSTVEDIETWIRALCAQLATVAPELRPCWKLAGFALIVGRGKIKGPMDRFFPFADPVPASLPLRTLRDFAKEHGLFDLGENEHDHVVPPGILSAIGTLLAIKERAPAYAEQLYELMERLRSEHRENRAPGAALKQMAKTKSALGELEIGRMTSKQLRQLRSELAAIQHQVAILLDQKPDEGLPKTGILSRLFN